MAKIIKLEFELENDEFEDLMDNDSVRGRLSDFVFEKFCQRWGMGFVTHLEVKDKVT